MPPHSDREGHRRDRANEEPHTVWLPPSVKLKLAVAAAERRITQKRLTLMLLTEGLDRLPPVNRNRE